MTRTADQMRRHNAHPNARKRRKLYMKTAEGRAANRKAQENYKKRHPEKVKVQQQARHEPKAKGGGHKCARCGKAASHKHHTDYGKGSWVWLCHEHHVKAHHPKSNLKKGDEPMTAPKMIMKGGQPGKYVGEEPAEPAKPEPAAHAIDKAEDEEKELVKSFAAKSLSNSLLVKGLYGEDWTTRFQFTPFEAQALKIEEEYQAACLKLDQEHEKYRKVRNAVRKKYDQLIEKEAPYFDVYDKRHDLREKYDAKKRSLLLKYLAHQRKQVETRKSLEPAGEESLAKSLNSGKMPESGGVPAGENIMEKSDLSSLYNEIMGRDVDALLKAETPDDTDGEPDPEKVDKAVPAVVTKSMNSVQHGEAGTPMGTPSSSGTSAGGGGASGGQEFNTQPKTGMPQGTEGEYRTEQWSDDDEAVEQQLKNGGMKPLERTVPHGGADLGQNATMGAPGEVHKSFQPSEEAAARAGMRDMQGVGYGVAPQPQEVQKSETPIAYWSNGAVLYSNGDDEAIAKAQNEQGYITPEPTLGVPQSPLMKSDCCTMCKSMVPGFLSVCPTCGFEKGMAADAPHGSIIMEKSVARSLQPSGGEDLCLPAGVFTTPSE